jgi:hypothetical protein
VVFVLDQIVSVDVPYEFIAVVRKKGSSIALAHVSSERFDPEASRRALRELGLDGELVGDSNDDAERSIYFLCVFDQGKHGNLGSNGNWSDYPTWEDAMRKWVEKRFGEPLTLAWRRETTGAHREDEHGQAPAHEPMKVDHVASNAHIDRSRERALAPGRAPAREQLRALEDAEQRLRRRLLALGIVALVLSVGGLEFLSPAWSVPNAFVMLTGVVLVAAASTIAEEWRARKWREVRRESNRPEG